MIGLAHVLIPRPEDRKPLDPEILEQQDCVAILTDHETVDYAALVLSAPLVFDARGVTLKLLKAPNLILP